MYFLITENFKEQHTEIVKIILETVPAYKIYFLGSTLMYRRTESIFMTDASTCNYVGHYYILVLVENGLNVNAVHDKIENNCKHFIPVTAIVLYTQQFNQWLEEGHQFVRTVGRIAIILHGTDDNISVPESINEELNLAEKGSILNQGINRVTEFLAGADLYRIREQNKMAAFMLHQAAEQALLTILRITTGLYLNTHNLDKLIRYCSMVSNKLAEIFPRNNEKNERLFHLLQKAYTGSRYDKEYSVCANEIILITERVKVLQNNLKDLGK